jgi:hypothetical protein
MQGISVFEATPSIEHATIFSSVWSQCWPTIAANNGFSASQIASRLETRTIDWWIKAIEVMPLAQYALDKDNNFVISYLLYDSDVLSINQKQTSLNTSKKDENPCVYIFAEKAARGSDMVKQIGKDSLKKRTELGYNVCGSWIMKSNSRSLAYAAKTGWKKVLDLASPVWDPGIDFEYWVFDNTSWSSR